MTSITTTTTTTTTALTPTEQRQSSLIRQRANEIQKRPIQDGDKLLIDFFAGAGGATQGFVLAGLKAVYIVEAEPTKVQQYRTNFGNDVEVFRRPDEFWPQLEPAYIYAETAVVDSTVILSYLDKYIKRPGITFHVHASPSCRAISSGGRTKKTYGNKDLGNSESTFKWTATVLGLMKEELKDRMTWSLEDSSRLLQKKYDPWRALLPLHTPDDQNTWDFTELGLPQDRVRYVALDKDLSGLVADGGKLANVVMDPADTYVKKLINAQQSPEVQNLRREYTRGKSMKGKISMQKAFALAEKEMPTGVTDMMGQSSAAQVPSLIRKQNRARNAVAPTKKNRTNGTVDLEAHAEIYVKLTKLAYNDLREFIQTLELTNKVFNVEGVQAEVQAYVANAKRFLQDLSKDDIDSYIDACVSVLGGSIRYAGITSFATHTNILVDDLFNIRKIVPDPNTMFGFNPRPLLTPKMAAKLRLYKVRTVGELRDAFGLRIARYYSRDVTDGGNVDLQDNMPTETRPISAPAMTIQAQGDKDWYIPLFEGSRWHFTGTTVAKMTPMHLKILGGFPLGYNFGDRVDDNEYDENARKAVGDSVPPLVTFRLGMAMMAMKDVAFEDISNEVAIHTVYNFENARADVMEAGLMPELLREFKRYLNTTRLENPDIVYNTIEQYFENEAEFLGEDMLFFKVNMLGRRSQDESGGINLQTYGHWLTFLNEIYRKGFFTERLLKGYIKKHNLGKEWIRKNRRFTLDKLNLEKNKIYDKMNKHLKQINKNLRQGQRPFRPSNVTVGRIMMGLTTRQEILSNVYGYILEIRENSGSSSRSASTSRSPSIENVLNDNRTDNNNNNPKQKSTSKKSDGSDYNLFPNSKNMLSEKRRPLTSVEILERVRRKKKRVKKKRLKKKRAREMHKQPQVDVIDGDDDENQSMEDGKKTDSSGKKQKFYKWKTMEDFIADPKGGGGRSATTDEEKDIEDPTYWGPSDSEYVNNDKPNPINGRGRNRDDAIDLLSSDDDNDDNSDVTMKLALELHKLKF